MNVDFSDVNSQRARGVLIDPPSQPLGIQGCTDEQWFIILVIDSDDQNTAPRGVGHACGFTGKLLSGSFILTSTQ
ncbi:MAG: hypothetical protein R5N60_07070 [Cutibacterium granulosum]|nr:hypothetical protein [Cutibacterium granulosum]